jgi:cytochrome c551
MQGKQKIFQAIVCGGLALMAVPVGALSPAEEGRRVYLRENCYGCHGGRGGGGMGPNLRRERPDESDVRGVTREGGDKGMPAYPNLTRQDTENLGAYFRSLRSNAEPTFTHWWEAIPSQ